MEELKHVSPYAYQTLGRYRDKLVYRHSLMAHGPRLVNQYPSISRPRHIYIAADPWVIALAIIEGMTVVCSEKPKRDRKMPDVCKKEKVPCLNLVEFLRAECLV
jgi:hypothetical protein